MTRFAVVLALAAAGALPLAGQQPPRPAVDTLFRTVAQPGGPGCAVGVAQQGVVAYSAGYGSANLDYGLPITPRSVFYLASVSKQFTAASVAIAAREGYLSLGDDIRRWLPELPEYSRPITIRHLIHHTSGLRDYLSLLPLAGRPLENVLTDAEMLSLIARQRELNFAPGDEYLYSNTGYVLLAEIVKRATGRSLRAYADEKIFQPLGMRHTHFHDDAGEIVPGRVIGYAPAPGGWAINHLFHFDQVGDGGLYSTVEDLLTWTMALDQGKLIDHAFVAALEQRGTLANGGSLPYAFGQTHGELRGLRVIEHGGALSGFRTHVLRFPAQDLSVVVLCNSARLAPAPVARQVAAVFLDSLLAPVSAPGAGVVPPDRPARDSLPLAAAELARFAGSWSSEELEAAWHIELRAGVLYLHQPRRPEQPLRAVRERVLATPTSSLVLRFDESLAAFQLDAGRVRNLRFGRTR